MTCASCSGHDLEVFKGRDKIEKFYIAGIGTLSGAAIVFTVKQDIDDTEIAFQKKNTAAGGDDSQIKIIEDYIKYEEDPESPLYGLMVGVVEVYIQPADTDDLSEADYRYDMVITISSGRELQVIRPSRFKILQPVTD